MSLFPFFTEDEDEGLALEENDILSEEAEEETVEPFREYEFDPATGKLTGRIIEGIDALCVWAVFALRSERYEHTIYSWDYGEEFSAMIGNSYEPDLLQSEVQRMVEECLLVNEHITGVADLVIEQSNDLLTVTFRMITDQGESEVTVNGL
jgi:hypothetical protein